MYRVLIASNLLSLCFFTNLFSQIEYKLYSSDDYSTDYAFDENAAWVASRGGLVRIDLESDLVKHFNPTNSGLEGIRVIEVEVDINGKKWVSTPYGLFSYDDENWEKVELPENAGTYVTNIKAAEDGTIWFMTHNNSSEPDLYSLKDGELRNHVNFFPGRIYFFDLGPDGQLYVATRENVIYKYDGQVAIEVVAGADYEGDIRGGVVDKNGDFVFTSHYFQLETSRSEFVLSKYQDSQTIELHRDTLFYFFSGTPSRAFKVDAIGDIWFQYQLTYGNGSEESDTTYLLKINGNETEVHTFASLGIDLPELSRQFILMDFDLDNNMWLRNYHSNLTPKVYKVEGQSIQSFNTDLSQIPRNLHGGRIGEDCQGNVYIDDYAGLSIFDGQEWTDYNYFENKLDNNSNGLFDDAELNPVTCELCFESSFSNTGDYLCVKDGLILRKNFPQNVEQIEISDEGDTYYLTEHGLYIVDLNGEQKFYDIESFPNYNMTTMELGKEGELWFHNYDRNIYKFHNQEWTVYNFNDYPFAEYSLLRMLVDENNDLWTFYDGGLVKFDGQSWELIPYELKYDFPILFKQDLDNRFWIGNEGFDIYDGLDVENINVSNSAICDNIANDVLFSKSGDIWFLHSVGVTRMTNRFPDSDHKVGGITFYDHNQDGIYNPSEDARLSNQRIINELNNEVTYTNSTGGYAFSVDDQVSSAVEIITSPEWVPITSSILNYQINNNDVVDLDFALYSDQLIPDMTIDLVAAPSICNGVSNYWLTIKNEGIETQAGTVSFSFDDLYSFASSNQSTSLLEDTYIEWEFENLRYTESKTFIVNLNTPNEDNFGEFFSFHASLISEDLQIDKEAELISELFCSYDPNDKLSQSTGESVGEYSLLEDALEYTIRFQNFGNYPARKVVIIDTLDQNLDVNTFEILSHSHDMATTIVEGNIVLFKFEDINLPFEEEDAAGSNGYVKYRVKAKADTPSETKIFNSASIYFDFNAGIITNTTENILVDELPLTNLEEVSHSNLFNIFPNPSNENFTIDLLSETLGEAEISIYNLSAELIYKMSTNTFPVSVPIETNGMYILTILHEGNLHYHKLVKTE